MARIPDTEFTFSVPASEAMKAGWRLFWMGVSARIRRRPWWSSTVTMKVEVDQGK